VELQPAQSHFSLLTFHFSHFRPLVPTLKAPPFRVHSFGCAPPLPLRLQRFCRHRFSRSWQHPEWLPLLSARDHPQSLSRTLFLEGNPPYTRCPDKFRCALSGGQILLPH